MKRSIRVFHWLPRVLCILMILLISMFAFDSFAPGQTIWQQITALFAHLIPSFALIAVLVIAWNWEYFGGILFIIIGLVLSPIIFMFNYNRTHSLETSLFSLVITFPFIVVGILFLVSYFKKKKAALK